MIMNNKIPQLTRDGLFYLLGKVIYVENLIEARFEEDERPSIGNEQALSEIEDIKEILFRLVLGPPDMRTSFQDYMKEVYDIRVNLEYSTPKGDDEFIHSQPRLSLVSDEEAETPK